MTFEAEEPTRGTPRRKEERRDTGPLEGRTTETPISDTVSTKLQRIAELAREAPQRAFLSLAHHIDEEFVYEAFRRTRKDGATGVDGRTAKAYEERLEENLRSLLERFKSGRYKAPPVRRTYIPKGDGKERRPIGIPTFEDKLLQRAVAMVLEAVYEQDFLPCSYGYRPGRSAHTALVELGRELTARGGGWVIEVDIKGFFDNLSHAHLRSFLNQRVRDGVLRRTIDKWLAAGVMEGNEWSQPDAGTPQGGVISPLLANVYLHEVIDRWFERDVRPRLHGGAFMIRYADDRAPRKRGRRPQPTESSAAQEMRDGPSDSDGRVRVQTTGSCFGPMAEVVSVRGKRRDETRQVSAGKTNVSEPSVTCRKRRDAIETRLQSLAWDESRGWSAFCLDDGRHKDGVSPAQALVWNVGTCTPMSRETSKRLTREEPSTDAGCRGGWARGSDEAR